MGRDGTSIVDGHLLGDGRVARDEHVANVLRLRRAALIAVIAWPVFGLVDWFIVRYIAPGRLWFFLSLRAVGLGALLAGVLLIYGRRFPTPSILRWVDVGICSVATILISVSTYEFGGLTSPLSMGVVVVLVCRSAIMYEPWRRAAVPFGAIVLFYPLTLGVMGAVTDRIGAQFEDSRQVAGFLLNNFFVVGAAAICVFGGHLVWSLKRQVFEVSSLGGYRLKRKIGAGGMGEVWLAHHRSLRRDVAVKILRPQGKIDSLAIARFEREVRATSELSHPNTVRIFDYGVTDDSLWYYAMELLDGYDLHEIIVRHGPLHPERAVRLIAQAAWALSEAHARGIVHRDIKPENLFLTSISGQGDFLKVLDFGLAKLVEADLEHGALTQVGWAVGTPQYVSPEVLFGHEADPRSDIYALGAVLYFALTGTPPFDHHDQRKTLAAHMRDIPDLPSDRIGRPLPVAVETVVMRCLHKDPDGRYSTSAELARALEASLEPRRARGSNAERGRTPAPAVVPMPSSGRTAVQRPAAVARFRLTDERTGEQEPATRVAVERTRTRS